MLGIMLATMCMSTWIMDIASCAMMIPIVDAIMRHLEAVDCTPDRIDEDNNDEVVNVSAITILNNEELMNEENLKHLRLNGNLPAVIICPGMTISRSCTTPTHFVSTSDSTSKILRN